jgi:D-alanyl-D-alanine carboxypeptidase
MSGELLSPNNLPGKAVPGSQGSTGASIADKSMKDILLVNATHSLPRSFHPTDLISLYEQKNRSFQLAELDIKVSKTVAESMCRMFAEAQEEGVGGFIITSGYRSRAEQEEIFSSTADGTAARPGQSEHETGLAFDVTVKGSKSFESTPQYRWLSVHCAEYGFILRYPKSAENVTGYPYEPWHYRFVGREHAMNIMSRGITLEHYCEELQDSDNH